jgi:hypothetical protein
MARRKVDYSIKACERWLAQGRGRGEKETYKPWVLNCTENRTTFVSNFDPPKALKYPCRVVPYTYYPGSKLKTTMGQFSMQMVGQF